MEKKERDELRTQWRYYLEKRAAWHDMRLVVDKNLKELNQKMNDIEVELHD